MQRIIAICVAVMLATGAVATEVTPVQKVIQLMQGMMEKGKAEKQAEQVQFAAYKSFCDSTAVDKKRAITEADERIEVLQADIQKFAADAERLGKEIAEHDEDISVWTGDVNAATKVREIEKADYDALHQDYSESLDALQRAIAVLKKTAHDRKQKPAEGAFVQVAALQQLSLIPKSAKRVLEAFLQQDPAAEGLAVTAPEANAYEFQSNGVVEMLEKLQDKFQDEFTTLEKEEVKSVQAYEMMMQDLKRQIAQATKDSTEKSEAKAKALQSKADAVGDLEDTTTTRDADKKYLDDLVATCSQKAGDFVSRQQLRSEELEAVGKAIEIISSGAVSGSAGKHLPGLLQTKKGSIALAQLRSSVMLPAQQRAIEYLQSRARSLNSRVLAALSVRAQSDPFGKVKKMIKDLITRLMEEANEEAEHKGWCDTELSTNEQTRQEKTEAVELLHAEIDQLEASISKLTQDIADLTQAVAELNAAVAKATKLRQEEKAENEATIADSQAAQVAVAQALLVLKEFYAKAAEATSLLQQQPEAPEIFDAPYKGMAAESGGVVGMIEVIEKDFARLESDTSAAEASAQSEYDQFMTDSKVDLAGKTKDIENKSAKKQDQEQALVTKKGDLEGTQKELDAALAYFDKLKPSCIDSGVSFEDRVSSRKEEIESLQEALRILNGEDLA